MLVPIGGPSQIFVPAHHAGTILILKAITSRFTWAAKWPTTINIGFTTRDNSTNTRLWQTNILIGPAWAQTITVQLAIYKVIAPRTIWATTINAGFIAVKTPVYTVCSNIAPLASSPKTLRQQSGRSAHFCIVSHSPHTPPLRRCLVLKQGKEWPMSWLVF